MLGRYLGGTPYPSVVVSSSSMWGVDPLANHDMGPRACAMVGYTSGGFGYLIRNLAPPYSPMAFASVPGPARQDELVLTTSGLCDGSCADQAGLAGWGLNRDY